LSTHVITQILDNHLPVEDVILLYKSGIPEEQQRMLVQSIVLKQAKNPDSYDTYFISKLTRELKVDFEKLIDEQEFYNSLYEKEVE
jgi:hypothetical protein